MSEGTIDIAEFTAMNEENKQAIFKTQMRNISERMAEGWWKWRKGKADEWWI